MQAADGKHDARQGRRNGGIGRVGKMPLAFHIVVVEAGPEGALHVTCHTAKSNRVTRARHSSNLQIVLFEPVDDLLAIGGARTESVSELLRREPAMKMRRPRILLIAEKLIEFSLLRIGGA